MTGTTGIARCECCGNPWNGQTRPGRLCIPCRRCTVCGEPLDPALIDAGLTDHGEEPENS